MINPTDLTNIRSPRPDYTVWVQGRPDQRGTGRCQLFHRTVGGNPIMVHETMIFFRPDGGETIDLSGSRLVTLREQRFQTRFDQPDFLAARFFPGRNVVVLFAENGEQAVCQVNDWPAAWLRLRVMELVAGRNPQVRGQAAADVLHELSLARLLVKAR